MRRIAALFLPVLMFTAAPAAAQQIVYQAVEETAQATVPGSDRFVTVEPAHISQGIAAYGPFRVLDEARVALVDATDERSPAHFAAMLRDHPGVTTLELVECPGTDDDYANLQLGRMIRARGLATHVPNGGSVRSGGVELFLAGVTRRIEPRAEFAVHSWIDEDGRQPQDFPADAPENRLYLDYYRQMGMTAAQASAFYAMTNSVPNAEAKWLTAAEMAVWVRPEGQQPATVLAAATLDSGRRLH